MSTLQYTTPAGHGQDNLKTTGTIKLYASVTSSTYLVKVAGWDYETGMIHEDIDDQIDQAFANVDHILKEAGGKGWDQVFRANSYHIPLDDRAQKAMFWNFEKWIPKHKALWTCVGVVKLGGGDVMRVEIEVQAFDMGA